MPRGYRSALGDVLFLGTEDRCEKPREDLKLGEAANKSAHVSKCRSQPKRGVIRAADDDEGWTLDWRRDTKRGCRRRNGHHMWLSLPCSTSSFARTTHEI